MKKVFVLLTVVICASIVCAVGASARGAMPDDAAALLGMKGGTYYLAYNLHGDLARGKIYSTNYQTAGHLVPWGTEIKIINILRNYLTFREKESGRVWNYWFSRRTRRAVSLKEHIGRLFTKDIDGLRKKVADLSELDRDGIYEGRPLLGMSREGILIAMGYPPEFANPQDIMAARDWRYWLSRYDKLKIGFNRQGKVASIVD